MLASFCLRVACGMIACLLLFPTALVNPRFYRTHFLTALGFACGALLLEREAGDTFLLTALGIGMALAFLGSFVWSLEGAPGGGTLIVLTTGALGTALARIALAQAGSRAPAEALLGSFTSAAVLGSALTAMLMGHSYLIAPSMSLRPLLSLLAALAVAIVARMGVDGYVLGCWTSRHSLGKLGNDTLLWLPLRWGLGFVAPLALDWMAWQAARIRSTQSATGILYVAVIFCFLGELTSQLLRETGLTL